MTQPSGARVLVIEDEPAIARALRSNLARHDFEVRVVETGQGGIDAWRRWHPDLLILDLGLPDIEGLDVIREVRASSATPIVVLSVRGSERDKVAALDLGADDYLTKPFGVDELLARIRVALRHAAGPTAGAAPVFKTGDLEVDLERRRVTVAGREVRLTPTEYNLLKAFVSNPDRLLTDRILLHDAWGPEYGDEAHYLHVYMARLRKKIEADPQTPRYLKTEPGVGYRLVTSP
jgi:two-component system KDP operon response regulator KdpE